MLFSFTQAIETVQRMPDISKEKMIGNISGFLLHFEAQAFHCFVESAYFQWTETKLPIESIWQFSLDRIDDARAPGIPRQPG